MSLENVSDVVQSGDKKLILDYLATRSIQNSKLFRFSSIFWLLKDKDFYFKVIAILKKRLIFNRELWGFAFYHGDVETIADLISYEFTHSDTNSFWYLEFAGRSIDCFKPKEFKPIINSRFHQLDDSNTVILNIQLRKTYTQFLRYLFVKGDKVQSRDWLVLAYYLVLQDRIKEAI